MLFESTSLQTSLNPPLKWAGGKRWLLPKLKYYWQGREHLRLVEPFAGGLSIALGLSPTKALLNDINPHLVNFYEEIRRGLAMTIDTENNETLFYMHRERFNTLVRSGNAEGRTAAQLFYFLNRTFFNGLCRFNRLGDFKV